MDILIFFFLREEEEEGIKLGVFLALSSFKQDIGHKSQSIKKEALFHIKYSYIPLISILLSYFSHVHLT